MDSRFIDLFHTKFVQGGRDLKSGVDCQGIMLAALKLYGYEVKDTDTAVYSTEMVSGLIKDAENSGKWEKIDQPEEGCVVVMAIDPMYPNLCQHLGVCVEKNKFMHILDKRGVCVDKFDHPFFKKKIRGFYRWIG